MKQKKTYCNTFSVIQGDYGAAEERARKAAAIENVPHTIWKHCNDYWIIPEKDDIYQVIKNPTEPIRPVVIIDPDGTEHR